MGEAWLNTSPNAIAPTLADIADAIELRKVLSLQKEQPLTRR